MQKTLELHETEPVGLPTGNHNTLSIIERAVERGTDPEQLGKLLDLHERWEAKQAEKAYNVAMKACQEEMPVVVKNAQNQDNKSRYSTLDNVLATVKDTITKHGFSLSFGSTDAATPNHVLVTCDVMHVGGHTKRYSLSCPYDTTGPKGGATKTAIQGMGSSVSYGRRYLVYMIFNVCVADEDDDGTGGGPMKRVSEQQAAILREWMEKLPQASQDACLDWLKVDTIESIPAADFQRAFAALQGKVRQLEKK